MDSYFLSEVNTFQIFGREHLLTLAILALIFFAVIFFAKNHLNTEQQKILGLAIALFSTLGLISRTYIYHRLGTFTIVDGLPLYICRLVTFFVPFLMWYKNKRLFGVLYFWILAGTFQALLTPDLPYGYPHFDSIYYWQIHGTLVLVILYAVFVYGLKPDLTDLKNAFLIGFLYLVIVHLINIGLDANYSYTMQKPKGGSILDFMGPWPWYLLSGNLLALFLFALLYLPFRKGKSSLK